MAMAMAMASCHAEVPVARQETMQPQSQQQARSRKGSSKMLKAAFLSLASPLSWLSLSLHFSYCHAFAIGRPATDLLEHPPRIGVSKLYASKDVGADSNVGTNTAGTGPKPIIAVIGSGAVGCYYGARLYETGLHDVRFHMRGDHYTLSKSNGLNVTSYYGDIFIPPEELGAYDDPNDMGTADWVIVALKSTSLNAAPALVRPLLGAHTRVIAIMNGMIDQDFVDMLENDPLDGEEKKDNIDTDHSHHQHYLSGVPALPQKLTCCASIYAGMALVCSNKIGPGRIDHSYAGKLTGALSASSSDSWTRHGNQDEERQAFFDLWGATKIEHVYEEDLTRGRWSKMCWNLPFNGISVAMGGITVDKIVNDPGLRRLAYMVIDETIAAGNADLEGRGAEPSAFLGKSEKDAMMNLSDTMGPYKPSTMLDFKARRPMEVKYLFRKPLDRAKQLNVPVPHLETLVTQIEAFQRMYDLY
mmetsp:Transcript_20725/g.46245  ORF Transcript_20725/g.46245 Transcript_20725/m.46245 type:complete len:472 (-) Transcript_20725:74-1489(-)